MWSIDKKELLEAIVDLALSDVQLETIDILHCCRIQKEQSKEMLRQLQLLDWKVDVCSMALQSTSLLTARAASVDRSNKKVELL